MQILKHIIFTIATLVFVGCTDFDDVRININGDDVKINSVKGSRFKLNIPVEIDNPTTKNLMLKKINADVRKNGYNFAKLDMNENIEIKAETKEKYIVILNGKIVDPMGVMFSGFSFRNTQNENYTLNGFIKVGTKTFSRKIKFKNADFETFINSFGNKTNGTK
ncbi:MAG: hypothetical protein LBQ28_08520 [Prevotellaceae bacterium]|jgi:LEA14-like dessication related protein|nr:hypothetical protein [Prevotellaceae bacterium]